MTKVITVPSVQPRHLPCFRKHFTWERKGGKGGQEAYGHNASIQTCVREDMFSEDLESNLESLELTFYSPVSH